MARLVCLALAAVGTASAADHPPLDLELDVSSCSTKSVFTVYFDTGDGFESADSVARPVAGGIRLQRLNFPLPEGSVGRLRLDPLTTEGTVIIDAARLRTLDGHEVGRVDLRQVAQTREVEVAAFLPAAGTLQITAAPGASNPQCVLNLEPAIEVGPRTVGNTFGVVVRNLIPFDLWLDLAEILWLGGLAVLARRWLRARWPAWRWQVDDPASARPFGWLAAWLLAPVVLYAWLLLLNQGHSPLLPDSESSWAAVMTYAVVHHWQFGRQIILTFGPAISLSISSYSHAIDGTVTAGQLLCKAWFVVLMIWVGRRLPLGRRVVFWATALIVFAGVSGQALFSFSVVAAGLPLARAERRARWLLAPTLVYLATVALIKVSFTLSAVVMLAAVGTDRARRGQWRTALALAAGFVLCFCAEWVLLRQHLGNLPIYLRGSFEMVNGFSQAMALPPDPGVLLLGLGMVLAAAVQLGLLFLPDRRPRWANLPLLGLLAAGLLLSWKASFVRADGHVLDWFAYALASAAAAPAFVPPERGLSRRWLEPLCAAVVLFAGAAGIPRVDSALSARIEPMLADRWRSALFRMFHGGAAADAEQQALDQNRATYALPRVKALAGQHTVDMQGDEQAVALLNDLNFRPRPSFVSYSTYTPWLMNLDVAYYLSPQAPDFVLFKLVSIDDRLPTLQSGPLLLLLAEYYQPVLTENGYVLFQRREQPRAAGTPANFPLLSEGDLTVGEPLPLSLEGTVWCQLEMRETFLGKLRRMFYQPPAVWMGVGTDQFSTKFRIVPQMASSGFLLNPMIVTGDDFTRWLAGQPLPQIVSVRIADSAAVSKAFQPQVHYKLYQVPFSPAAIPPATPAAIPPATPAADAAEAAPAPSP